MTGAFHRHKNVRAFVSAWKKSFDAGKSNREKAGLNERYVMPDVEKPNCDRCKKFVSDPALREDKKASAGTTNTAGK